MQTVTTILFTALVLGFLLLFLAPGRWWPRVPRRRPPPSAPPARTPPDDAETDDEPPPRRYTGYLN